MLRHISLFRNVPITRDGRIVTDLSPSEWAAYLRSESSSVECIYSEDAAYYRMPEPFVVEGDWDLLRTAEYGMLSVRTGTGGDDSPWFFWVDRTEPVSEDTETGVWQTARIVPAEDTWANRVGTFAVPDAFVMRRHMPRWDASGNPVYYHGAAQGTECIYSLETDSRLLGGDRVFGVRWFAILLVTTDGKMRIRVVANDMIPVTYPEGRSGEDGVIAGAGTLFNGTVYKDITAGDVQGIFQLDAFPFLDACLKSGTGMHGVVFEYPGTGFSLVKLYDMASEDYAFALDLKFESFGDIFSIDALTAVSQVTVDTGPKPSRQSGETYDVRNEPMMYTAPARLRKIVSGAGNTLADIPPDEMGTAGWSVAETIEPGGCMSMVFPTGSGGLRDQICAANAKGMLVTVPAPSLPVFQSAWKIYESLNKRSEDTVHTTKLTVDAVLTALGVVTTFIPLIGPAAKGVSAGARLVSRLTGIGLAGAGGSKLANTVMDHDLKMTSIRNSPCTVSAGSGLGAVLLSITGVRYAVLRADSSAMRSLEDQYYYYGYFVNRTERGMLNLRTRTLFDFIQTQGAQVRGVTGEDASRIAEILDAGVTVWHDPSKIGSGMAYENREIEDDTGTA